MYGIYEAVEELSTCEIRRIYTLHSSLIKHNIELSIQKSLFPQGDYSLGIRDKSKDKDIVVFIPFIWKQSHIPGVSEAINAIRYKLQRAG